MIAKMMLKTNRVNAIYAVVGLEASQRTELELVKAMRTRCQTGRYPTVVDSTDPFDGKPLRMQSDGDLVASYPPIVVQ